MTLLAALEFTPVDDGTVIAHQSGNPHVLVWDRVTGSTVLDHQDHPMGVRLDEHAFQVQAATLFGRLDLVPHIDLAVPHGARGLRRWDTTDGDARFQIPCACSHFTTVPCADEFAARAAFGAHLIATGAVPQQTRSQS